MGFTTGKPVVTQIDGFTEEEADQRFLLPRRNLIINGNFDIWQRGNTGSSPSDVWNADRWKIRDSSNSGGSFTWTRFRSANNGNYLKIDFSGLTGLTYIRQTIEDVRTAAGGPVTISFELNSDVDCSTRVELKQRFGNGGTPSSEVILPSSHTTNPSGSWVRHTVTIDVPSVSDKTLGTDEDDYVEFLLIFAGVGSTTGSETPPSDGAIRVRKVQMEIGSIATPFEYKGLSQEELDCRRFYQIIRYLLRYENSSEAPNSDITRTVTVPTTMRGTANATFSGNTGTQVTVSSLTHVNDGGCVLLFATTTGPYQRWVDGYIVLNAELS